MMQRKTPSILKLAFAFTALSAAAVASPAQAFQPRDTHEVNAVNVRILQSEMMVAALTCNMRTRYNTVVVRYQGELVSHARVLKKMFRRDHGARSRSWTDLSPSWPMTLRFAAFANARRSARMPPRCSQPSWPARIRWQRPGCGRWKRRSSRKCRLSNPTVGRRVVASLR